jgi:hypothetical protein
MPCFVTNGLETATEPILKNCHGDVVRVNEIGDIEFCRKDSDKAFHVSRQDLGVLVRFLVEQMERGGD